MISQEQAGALMGATVRSIKGDKMGKITQIFLDDQSGQPEWATVNTGLFGTRESFLPLAQIQFDGTEARVPYDEETVNGAPKVDADGGRLSRQEEAELYRYFGLTVGTGRGTTGGPRLRRYALPEQAGSDQGEGQEVTSRRLNRNHDRAKKTAT